MIKLIPFIIIFLFSSVTALSAEGPPGDQTFYKANQAYEEGRYQEAIQEYHQLLNEGHVDGDLYYNLGNAYFQMRDLGRAILSYERAILLIPRDRDLLYNHRLALDRTRDPLQPPKDFIGENFFWLESFSLHELSLGFLITNLLFWGILIVQRIRTILFIQAYENPSPSTKMGERARVRGHHGWSFYPLLLFLLLWVVTGVSLGLKYYQSITDNRAVVLSQEVQVLGGPDHEEMPLFKVYQGAMVLHERSQGDWSLITLNRNKQGWAKTREIENVILCNYIPFLWKYLHYFLAKNYTLDFGFPKAYLYPIEILCFIFQIPRLFSWHGSC